MQTPLLSSGLLDLPVKDRQFSEPNGLSKTLMVSLVIKHMPLQSFGVGGTHNLSLRVVELPGFMC
jgi:hypothetical protein